MALVDQINHPVSLSGKPLRIVSLVPSQTELLAYLGLEESVIGITKFCIHPNKWFREKQRIGGTKNVKLDEIEALKPDLIIANKEENTKDDILHLQKRFQVYTSDIVDISSAYQMMVDIGKLTNTERKAEELVHQLKKDFKDLAKLTGTALYMIWREPFMSAGTNTFINTMLKLIGLKNAHTTNLRYDEVRKDEITALKPDYVFLSSEPYPFKQKHIDELKELTSAKILLVDGEMFSWYGNRLLHFKDYVNQKLLPAIG